jgi:hypothetical protein
MRAGAHWQEAGMPGHDRFSASRLAATAACCAMCAARHSQSAIDTTNLAGVLLTKTVRSMRDIHDSHIASQPFDYGCGAAALATRLKFSCGTGIPETEPMRRMIAVSKPEIGCGAASRRRSRTARPRRPSSITGCSSRAACRGRSV